MANLNVPLKAVGDKLYREDYNLLANAINTKAVAIARTLTGVASISTVQHDFGGTYGWSRDSFELFAFVQDSEGWTVTGARVEKTTNNVASLVLSDTVATPFSGRILLLAFPLTPAP